MSLNRSPKEQTINLAYQKTCKKTWSQRRGKRGVGDKQEWEYSNIPPQTHGGLRETILSLEVKARKGLGERGLVKISASWS